MFDFFKIDSTSIGIILIVIILWIHVLKNKFGVDALVLKDEVKPKRGRKKKA